VLDAEMMSVRRPHKDRMLLHDNEVVPYVTKRKEQGKDWVLHQRGEVRICVGIVQMLLLLHALVFIDLWCALRLQPYPLALE
jgi:hypothetical protein